MKLQFKVFGVEVASWELALDQSPDAAVTIDPTLVTKGIKRLSTWWVKRGMA